MSDAKSTGIEQLQSALNAGRYDTARRALMELDDDERRLLEVELGADAVRRLYRSARRRRGSKLGRVVVVNGIMGSLLDTVDRRGEVDRVWINLFRLAAGRMSRLKLTPSGQAAEPEFEVRVAGLHKTYLPLIMELDARWDVLQFPFDWRQDIDLTAERLADSIAFWARGEPVHIIAHSMGGLVSRRMIQRRPEVWRSMDDPDGRRRGGRLVMLGTPNRGSYMIPLALTGREKAVKFLATIDLPNRSRRLLEILATFPGLYQMLPSPKVDSGDDHGRLFDARTWGDQPVRRPLLERAKRFQDELFPVTDPERLVYIAGHDQKTTHRIRVKRRGVFEYQQTRQGDGSVPHELGLLPGVETFWLREAHGSLPKNSRFLDAILPLLTTGSTSLLATGRPSVRSIASDGEWLSADEMAPADPVLDEMLARRPRRGHETIDLGRTEQAAIEAALVEDYLGSGRSSHAGDESADDRPTRGDQEPPPTLRVEVVWGDVRQVEGDIYCCGHYEEVLPTGAEWALDSVISQAGARGDEMVLHALTKRGVLRGALGEVHFFPWAESARRTVAVAGMGRAGTFNEGRLRQLARSLAWSVGCLPRVEKVCTVLIGAGDGGLTVEAALNNLIAGMADALTGGLHSGVRTVRIVELELPKAYAVQEALTALGGTEKRIDLRFPAEIAEGAGGRIGTSYGMSLLLGAAAKASVSRSENGREALRWLIERVPSEGGRRGAVREALDDHRKSIQGAARRTPSVEAMARALDVDPYEPERASANPVRVSYERAGRRTRVAAIHDSAVVPQRELRTDFGLVREAIERCVDPDNEEAHELGQMLHQLLVPRDFRALLGDDKPIVFEVDRRFADVHWELMANRRDTESDEPFLGLRAPIARQLKTEYSPPPLPVGQPQGRRHALVVGDPGDPAEGDDLPGARAEAEEVVQLLRAKGFRVTARIGAPEAGGSGPLAGIAPATRFEIVRLLSRHEFDVLHYAGHGDFDPDDPSRVGWVFKDGLLTAAELESIDRVPQLIVANACLSARTSRHTVAGPADGRAAERHREKHGEMGLLPSLADEFFRRGVRNYVGTAWEIDDEGAITFTRAFYEELLDGAEVPRGESTPIGEAIRAGRKRLWDERRYYANLWAAYQHYGSPLAQI